MNTPLSSDVRRKSYNIYDMNSKFRLSLSRYPSDENAELVLAPRKNVSFESKAVFNPSVVLDENVFRMLYRTYPSELEETTLRLTRPGFHFKNQISYIGYAESRDGKNLECSIYFCVSHEPLHVTERLSRRYAIARRSRDSGVRAVRATLALKAKMKDFELGGNNWVEPLREWVLDTKQATFLSSSADLKEIRSFVQKIGTNHTVRDKTAHFSVPVPSQSVAKRRRILPTAAALPPRHSGLSEREVQFCGPCRI